jgi:hypothetical protein
LAHHPMVLTLLCVFNLTNRFLRVF